VGVVGPSWDEKGRVTDRRYRPKSKVEGRGGKGEENG